MKMFLLNIFIMMELIKWQSAINASMHCRKNGSEGILKMFIKSWYTIHLSFITNTNSLTKYNLTGLKNGCLKMKSKQWRSAKIGELPLIFFKFQSLALKSSKPAAVLHATL